MTALVHFIDWNGPVFFSVCSLRHALASRRSAHSLRATLIVKLLPICHNVSETIASTGDETKRILIEMHNTLSRRMFRSPFYCKRIHSVSPFAAAFAAPRRSFLRFNWFRFGRDKSAIWYARRGGETMSWWKRALAPRQWPKTDNNTFTLFKIPVNLIRNFIL